MTVVYHPSVQADVNEIMDHYREVGGEHLAERFFRTLMDQVQQVAAHPERFAYFLGQMPFRRAKLDRFPHIVVFRILKDRVRVTVIKHEKRRPSYGMSRI